MSPIFVELNLAGPSLIACGTPELKEFLLPKILDGEVIWCQGFSEPGSGSDLGSLRTRGRIDGDDLIIDGQKLWSSYADIADWQELLIRTDPAAKTSAALSWVICTMGAKGITVRPIRNMAGTVTYFEVFYDSVRVPLANTPGPTTTLDAAACSDPNTPPTIVGPQSISVIDGEPIVVDFSGPSDSAPGNILT